MNRFKRKRVTGAVASVVLALVVAGCGSSSHSASGTTATTASSSSSSGTSGSSGTSATTGTSASTAACPAGSKGAPIKVEGLIGVTDFGTGSSTAAKIRFDQANASGQIPCGRKIDYLGYLDDGSAPDTDLAAVRQLIDQQGVFAIDPVFSAWIEQATTYINQKNVPTIGWGISAGFCPTSNFSATYLFGFNGCAAPPTPIYAPDTASSLDALFASLNQGSAKGKTIAIIGENDVSLKTSEQSAAAQDANQGGMDVVYAQVPLPPLPTVVTDFSPYVQTLMTSASGKPPAMIDLLLDPPDAFPMAKALRQAGYKGIITTSTYAPQLAASAADTYAGASWATAEAPTPQMQTILAGLAAGGLKASSVGQSEWNGYFSADYFVKLLQAVGPDLTQQRFRQVASTFTYEIPGVIGPASYPAGYLTTPSCTEELYSTGTKWTVAVPYTCSNSVLKKQGSNFTPVPYPAGVTLPSS